MIHANEQNQQLFIQRYFDEGIGIDHWWMDAGWYVNKSGWPNVGTWLVDSNRFPHGLRAVTDYAHQRGVKSIVWFEPERVTPGTWLYENHPEWLLGRGAGDKLLDLGNPQARAWLTDYVDQFLTEQGIDLYRQDYNIDPLPFWRGADAAERQGSTENHYVSGYLAYWDELLRLHPGLLIDSCASGGHRNDLETMRRAVPFLRSDYIFDPLANQCMSYGLALWLPYNGTGTGPRQFTLYELRSNLSCPKDTPCWDMRDQSLPYDLLRKVVKEWRGYAGDYLGDFYPLTPYSLERDVWMVWQFDNPEEGHGVVQAFRRDHSIYESAHVTLRGLEPAARYELKNLDEPGTARQVSGAEFMGAGVTIRIDEKPGAAVLTYRKNR
jgi:alpha-galactosidase